MNREDVCIGITCTGCDSPETAGTDAQRRPSRRSMQYFFLLGVCGIFSTIIARNPVLPRFSQAWGADDAIIGLVAFFSPFADILFSFPMVVLSDRFGRKRLLVASGTAFLVAPCSDVRESG